MDPATVHLFTRNLGNISNTAIVPNHGLLEHSHISNVTVGWTPEGLPSPFPLVIVSAIVSFAFAVIGFKTAASTWQSPQQPKVYTRPEGFEMMTLKEKWKWSRRQGKEIEAEARSRRKGVPAPSERAYQIDSERRGDMPAFIVSETSSVPHPEEEAHGLLPEPQPHHDQPPRTPFIIWDDSLKTKITVLFSMAYNTVRAIFAFVTTVQITMHHNGTHAASSTLFLLYLSLQTFASNRKIPRIINLIVVIDLILVGTAFTLVTWDFNSQQYGDAIVIGGNCPVYAPDCTTQAPHWSRIGCGASLPPRSSNTCGSYHSHQCPANPNAGDAFYPPYESGGSINSKNKLSMMEAVIGGIGTIWVVPTVLLTLYEAIRLFFTAESMRHLLWPVPDADQYVTHKKSGRVRNRVGWGALMMFAFLAVMGAFIVTILSIAGHCAGETKTYTATYMDSFGPDVTTRPVNVTTSSRPTYLGDATSWSDCFTVTTPKSNDGFFKEWLEHNEQATLRLVSLL